MRVWKNPKLNKMYVYNQGELQPGFALILVFMGLAAIGVNAIGNRFDGWVGLGALVGFAVLLGAAAWWPFRWACGRSADHEVPEPDVVNLREAMDFHPPVTP